MTASESCCRRGRAADSLWVFASEGPAVEVEATRSRFVGPGGPEGRACGGIHASKWLIVVFIALLLMLGVISTPTMAQEPRSAIWGAPPYTISALHGGQEIDFIGRIVPGAAAALDALLEGPGHRATTLRITSSGGSRNEARRILGIAQ